LKLYSLCFPHTFPCFYFRHYHQALPIAMGSTGDFTPLADTVLFKPVELGALKLEHRLVLSPLTRMRGTKESDGVWAPTTLNAEYYSQRASKGGFMLTEATPISRLVSVSKQRI
jgi:hypothetical protein